MTSLILRAIDEKHERYRLQIRQHDLGGTDYWTIAVIPVEHAILLIRTRRVSTLYDDGTLDKYSLAPRNGLLELRWDRTSEDDDQCFLLEHVADDVRTEIVRLDFSKALDVERTEAAKWNEDFLSWCDEFNRHGQRSKARKLRAEADAIDAKVDAEEQALAPVTELEP